MPIRKRRDGVGNGIVKATVESAKFVYGNEHFLFEGQFGDGLADIPIIVNDLVYGISAA